MHDSALSEDYRCLDLTPGASPPQVERAFRRKQALYAESVLATYSLLDGGGRQALLERLEAAYRRISAEESRACAARPAAVIGVAVTDPDPAAFPGRYLQVRREAAGLSLREVAGRTKIGPMKLLQIEGERYDQLPVPIYLRGFVVAYARVLGLAEPEAMARHFFARQRERVVEG